VYVLLAEHGDAPQWLVQVNARRVSDTLGVMGQHRRRARQLAAITSSQTVFAFW